LPRLTVNVPYEVLEKIMKAYPNLPPEEAIKQYLIETTLKGREVELPKTRGGGLEAFAAGVKERAPPVKCATPEDLTKLRRSLEDLLNPVTGKIDSLRSQFATVYEAMEKILERLEEISRRIEQAPALTAPKAAAVARSEESGQAPPRRRRTSAIEILKEQKVMYESDIASKIKNRDAFFERLKRDGAVVLELIDQRVAVDPEYWREFISRLEEISTNSEPELERALGKRGYQLLKALMRSTLAYFDATERRWKLMLEDLGSA